MRGRSPIGRVGCVLAVLGLLAAACGSASGEVPDGWQAVELEGLSAAVPPGWEPATEPFFRESQREYHSPDRDGDLPAVIALGAQEEGALADVGLMSEILKGRLDYPDLVFVDERDMEVPGGVARYHEYTFTTADAQIPARQMEIVIASEQGRGYNAKFATTQDMWDTADVEAFVGSISVR